MNIIFKRSFLLSLGYLFLVTCSGGNDSPTEPEPTPPAANFTFTPSSGYAPLTVQFTSTSTGDITTFAWDFQNNLTTESTQRNPEYTYTEPGVYSVRLAVQGPGGNDTKIQENSITVLEVNAPVIEDIAQQTNEDVPLQITLSGTDPQDLELTYVLTEGPQNGTVNLNGSTLIYTPDENWNGTETMKYVANNQYLDSNEATITITVNAVDDEPNTLDVSVETDEDTAISFVLNADEVDGDSYTFGILSNPSNGTIALNGNNVLYTPDANWNGVDTFTFEATDDRMAFDNKIIINVGTATITVNPINDAPVADNISVSLVENTALLISFSASDVESDNLSYSITSQPSNGGLGAVSGSQVLYTPNSDFNGTDSFTYQANDGTDNSNVATVTITITPANTAPVATNQSLTTDEDTSATLNLDATDINGDNLTYIIVENPSNATVSIDGSSATYTPNSDWNGTETFTWKANDGLLDSNTATVSVTVNAINDAPTANNISTSYDTRTDASVNITLSATDPEDDTLTYSIVSDASNGSTSISGSIVTYTASSDFEGTDTFTYKVNDGEYDSNTATVSITVDAEDAPTTNDVSASTNEDTAVTITLDGADEDGDSLTYSIVSSVSNGTLNGVNSGIVNGNQVTFTPTVNWNGTDTFTYKANDGTSDSNTSTVTITVSAINDAPTTQNVSFTTDEDTAYTESYTSYVTDVEGDALTITTVTDPSNGSAACVDTDCTYTPNQNFNGTDTFTYKVNDGELDSNISLVTVTVNPVNDAPVANDVSGSTNENRSMQLNITLDATDIDGDALTYSIVSDVSNGTTSISGSTLTYTPDSNWNGTDTFTYKANDGLVDSNTATGTITVSAVNDAPTTENVSASTNEDTDVDITLDGSDVEGSSLTYSIVSDVSNGTTSLSGSTVTFSPDSNWNGTDTFTYKANDGTDDSNTSTVTITVTAVNDAPTTSNITLSGNEDTVLQGSLVGSDIDGDDLTFTIVSQPTNGSVTITSDGVTVQFDPNNNWNGTDTFTYKASDGTEDSNISTASVTVIAVNDAPTINETSPVTLNEDSNVDTTLSGTDIDGDTITFSVVTEPSNGSVTLSGTNNEVATYTPTANYNGSDSFIYKANDGTDDSESATIFFTINAVNDAPVVNDITVSTNENRMMQLSITLEGTDVDGDNLTYQIVESVSNGTLTDPSAGDTVTYTPGTNFNGTDTFTYKANDGTVDSNTATVTITVTAVNDAPIALDITTSTDEDTSVDVTLDGSDVDGDDLTYSIVSDVSNGATSISGSTLTYTPSANFNGTDTFTYKANDGTADSNTATVTVTVAAVNDAPTTSAVSVSTNEDTAKAITLVGADVDGDDLTYSIVNNICCNGGGRLSGINGTSITYTPHTNFNGTETFTYKVNDGTANSNISTVTITVAAVNDAPVTSDQTASTDEDTAVDITLSSTDVEGDSITYSIVSDVSNGSTSLSGSTVTYIPTANYNGSDTFTFKANDGTDDSNTSTVTITVAAIADNPVVNDITSSTDEDNAVDISLDGSDPDGDTLTYSIVTDVSNGTTSLSGSTVTYTPDTDWNGTDTFTYIANDGDVNANAATVTITVNSVNDAPVLASNSTIQVDEDSSVSVSLDGSDAENGNENNELTFSIVSEPSNGTAVITQSGTSTTGAFSYTPNSNYNGTDSFTAKANDGELDSAVATFTITIAPKNDLPTTDNQTASTDEDTAVDITLESTEIDTGDSITYSIVSDVSNGSTSLSGSTVTYTPTSNYNGTDSFTFKANDGTGDSNTSTVTITVASVNDAPTVETYTGSTNEDTDLTISINQGDVDGDTATASIVSQPSNGTISSLISGTNTDFTYTPDADFNGTDTFTYKTTDTNGADSDVATGTITVVAVNDAPVAEDVTGSTNENRMMQLGITLVATDVDGDDLTYSIVSTNDGTVTVSGSTATYTPDANWNGTDTFTYKANDGTVDSNTATATITVASVEDTPITADVSASTDEDTAVDITLDGSDGDGDSLTYSVVATNNGSVTISGSTATYTPDSNYNGTDTFTYKANDGDEDSNTSTVTVTVAAVNDAPVVSDMTVNATEDISEIITLTATDVEGDAVTFSIVSDVSSPGNTNPQCAEYPQNCVTNDNSKVIFNGGQGDWNGTNSFTYKANDGAADSNTATVTIIVAPVDDAPVTTGSSDGEADIITVEDTPYDIDLSNYTTDVDSNSLTYFHTGNPNNGTFSISGSILTYTPDLNFCGSGQTLTFYANDGTSDSNQSSLIIRPGCVDDAPVAADGSKTILEDNQMSYNASNAGSGNLITDVDGGTGDIRVYIVSQPSNGTATADDGLPLLIYTPDDNFNGTDTFTYRADRDEDGNFSNTATFTVTVTSVEDSPVTADVAASTDEDTAVDITLDGSDGDSGDTLTYSIVSDVSNGSTSLSGSTVTYTPTANYNGTDTFTYKVNDGDEDSNTSTVTITVNSVEDSPLTSNVTATTDEDVAVAVSLSGTDGDSGDTLTYSIVSDVSNGSTSLSGSTVTYTPTANYNGTDSFTYKVNDGDEDSNTSTAVITIASVEDIPTTQDVSASTDEDNAVDITLSGSDGDSGDTLTYSIVSDVSNGSTSLSGSTVTYTPTANYNGTDTFTYKLNDGDQDSNTSTVTVTVASINDLPTTQDIATTINENRYFGRMTGITLQGTDVDGDDLTYSVVSDASNGSTSISGSTLTYTADQDYNGTETITYKANDGTGDSNTSTITITITPVNDTPVVSGTDDTYWNFDNDSGANEQVTVPSMIHNLLGSDPVTYSIDFKINQIANGGQINFFEQGNGGGLHDIRVGYYDVCGNDGNGNYNTSTNNPKLYITQSIRNNNGSNQCTIDGTNQSGNFGNHYYINSEVSNDGLKHNLTTTINPSTQRIKIYWNYVLVADDAFSGTTTGSGGYGNRLIWANNEVDFDIYKMTVWSGTELSESQIATNGSSVDQVVSATNQWNFSDSSGSSTITDSIGSLDADVANGYGGDSGETYTFNQVTLNKNNTANIDLSSYVTDVDGDNLTYSIVSDVTYGSTSLSGSTVTYTPTANTSGVDGFTWKANDGVVDSVTGNVDITITNNNNAPTVSNATASTDEDNAVDITLSSTDLDSDSITYSIVSDVSNGSTSLSGSTVTYTPSANYNGTDSFTYKANDGTDDSSTATVTITVAAVNDIPTTSNQSVTTAQDVALNITLSSTDNDGDTITYSIVSDVSNGSTSLSGSTVTYTPTSGFNGTDSFTFKANDGTADSNTSTVTITIAPPKYALDLSATDAGGFTVPSWENYNTTSDNKRQAGTFAAWIYVEETPSGDMTIISRDDRAPEVNSTSKVGTRTHFSFQVTSGLGLYFKSQYYSSHGDSGFTGQTNDNVITLNTWHHVAFSVQNNGCNNGTIYGNKKFYVDGVEIAGTSGYTQTNSTFSAFSSNCGQYGDGPNALVPYNTQISVGKTYRENTGNHSQFKGYIDEVVYYDTFMGESDITTMYNSGEWFDHSTLTNYTDNLMGWWNFDSQNLDETGGDTSGGTYQDGSATFSVSSID